MYSLPYREFPLLQLLFDVKEGMCQAILMPGPVACARALFLQPGNMYANSKRMWVSKIVSASTGH